eukprot:TRINITY_DN463_c0_g1_i2.p1 TRINITY_DN463_c0_g1~~TRINITY_DN463_c0_g1_i2.p1  ORF type:complete len:336 (-),score=70.26 TRINITY_DN463_c0_g1_i2:36-1043(-)
MATDETAKAAAQLLQKLQLDEQDKSEAHKFWDAQPMRKGDASEADGPVEVKTLDQVSKTPNELPAKLYWGDFDVNDQKHLDELYKLLCLHYVTDDEQMFRFDYSRDFLKWALQPPGWRSEWLVAIRAEGSNALAAFISGIPSPMCIRGQTIPMVEINFLCVHRKLRAHRLAPMLIAEVTRRVNLRDIWQAAYTAGVRLPTPVAACRYYHRSLNPKKLVEIKFSHIPPRMTLQRLIKLNKMPDKPAIPGFRAMVKADLPQVTTLLTTYLTKFPMHPVFTQHDLEHWLVPRKDVVSSWVVENGGKITDVCSYYSLPSTILSMSKNFRFGGWLLSVVS